ncbi:MAG TPA: hypothetical protein PK067_10410 [Kaistella chaponensis]|nr:hypothetical protein [Kaistella chaponensis]
MSKSSHCQIITLSHHHINKSSHHQITKSSHHQQNLPNMFAAFHQSVRFIGF